MQVVAEIIRRNGRLFAKRAGVVDRHRRYSWGEVDRLSNRIARLLESKGIRKGGNVGVLSQNTAFLYVFQGALAKLGLVLVPLNNLLSATELSPILESLDAEALFFGDQFGEIATELGGRFIGIERCYALSMLEKDAAAWPDTEFQSQVAESDRYSIIFTSGSTGRPKGVMRSNRLSFMNALVGCVERGFGERDVSIIYTPNFHVSFWESQANIAAMGGGTIVIMDRFDPDEYLDWVRRERATTFYGVYTSLKKLLEAPAFAKADKSSIRRVVLPFKIAEAERLNRIADMFEVPISGLYTGWGMSETGPLALNVGGEEWLARPGTTGRDVATVRTRIVDADGNPVATGEVGEIEVQAQSVFDGYWKMPEETNRAFRNGWFRSGDAGYRDEDNYTYFFSRARDVIKRGGENVSAQEVEDHLAGSPLVAEAAVIGVPDAHWEETVLAFVVPASGVSLSAEDVIEHARRGLAKYKVPQHVVLVDQLPKVSVGKVAKHILRERYLSENTAAERFGFLKHSQGAN